MKKGLSIIELLIALSLISIIIVYEITVAARCIYVDRKSMMRQKTSLYVEEAFDSIENEIDESDYVKIDGNSIVVFKDGKKTGDRIKLRPGNNLVIEYEGRYPQSIALCIREFEVMVHEQVFYVTVTDINGRKYEKCYSKKFEE